MSDGPREERSLTSWVMQLGLDASLRGALDRGEIEAFYQPQVDVATGTIVAVETLSRWRHPQYGLLPPNVFIPLAESSGVIHDLGLFMLEEGCRAVAAWRDEGLHVEVAINVSPTQLATADLVDRVASILQERSMDPRSVTIEITETVAVADLHTTAALLDGLRRIGVGISIDDFGTGHSTLAQLDGLRATELKIDKTLVQRYAFDGDDSLARVVDESKARGLRVVAEGVETAFHFDRVRDLNCDRAQGFFLGAPMPASDLHERLVERRTD